MDQIQAAKKARVLELLSQLEEGEREIERLRIKMAGTPSLERVTGLNEKVISLCSQMGEIRDTLRSLGEPIPGHI